MPTASHLGSVKTEPCMPSLLYSPVTEITFPEKAFGLAQIAQTVDVMVRLPVSARLCKEHAIIPIPTRNFRRPLALFIDWLIRDTEPVTKGHWVIETANLGIVPDKSANRKSGFWYPSYRLSD